MADSPPRRKISRSAADVANMPTLSIADIKELFVLMRDNEIAELQLEQQETKIHIVSKGGQVAPPTHMVPMMGMPQVPMISMPGPSPLHSSAAGAADAAAASAQESSSGSSAETASTPANVKTVFSPMVGTFYSSPAPDAPPFVRVGDPVSEDTVLCIIEAMKLMNEIKAEMKGKLYKMLVETGMPVEYNQPLFLIEP